MLTPQLVVERLSGLYGCPAWRPHGDPLTELVLAVLSQNTSDANSGRAFMRLRTRFPEWRDVLAAPQEELEDAIRVGGLGRIKAQRLKALLAQVLERRGSLDLSFLSQMPLEEAQAWLEDLPGVGPKTAACVLLFALGRPALPVDTHVHRVARRLGLVPWRADAVQTQKLLQSQVPQELVFPFHVLLIRHGRNLCRARSPLCQPCPLADLCPYPSRAAHSL